MGSGSFAFGQREMRRSQRIKVATGSGRWSGIFLCCPPLNTKITLLAWSAFWHAAAGLLFLPAAANGRLRHSDPAQDDAIQSKRPPELSQWPL